MSSGNVREKLLTNYCTVKPVLKGTWLPSLEENVYNTDDLQFQEENNLKHLYLKDSAWKGKKFGTLTFRYRHDSLYTVTIKIRTFVDI